VFGWRPPPLHFPQPSGGLRNVPVWVAAKAERHPDRSGGAYANLRRGIHPGWTTLLL